jgi:Flp pilus assembly CpaE family ATPase
VLDEASGLAAAAQQAAAGPLTPAGLASAARSLDHGLRVLTGLTRPDRWPELRPASVLAVWSAARAVSDAVVVDCGSGLEDDEELSFDTLAPRRYGAALVTVDEADDVVVVGAGDPVGLPRLIRRVAEVRERRSGRAPRVVVTQVRRSVVGRDPEGAVARLLSRFAGIDDPVLVPDDRAAADLALAEGKPLAEVAPRSPARQPLRDLARTLVP